MWTYVCALWRKSWQGNISAVLNWTRCCLWICRNISLMSIVLKKVMPCWQVSVARTCISGSNAGGWPHWRSGVQKYRFRPEAIVLWALALSQMSINIKGSEPGQKFWLWIMRSGQWECKPCSQIPFLGTREVSMYSKKPDFRKQAGTIPLCTTAVTKRPGNVLIYCDPCFT